MEVKPGYKQTDVGVIPEDWDVRSLAEICSKITDGTHDTPTPVRSGLPFLTAIHIKENFIDYEACSFLTEEDHRIIFARCNPKRGDVLMVNIGAGVATTALVDVDFEFSLKNVALLKPAASRASGRYLNQCLIRRKSSITQALSSGGAQPFLSLSQIGQIGIPSPPLSEQHAIATALSDVDGLLGGLDRLIAKKRDLKQAAMQQLLTGQTRLPGFHAEWEVKRLGDLFNFSGGYSASRDQLSTEGHCYLHYGDIHGSTKTCIDTDADFQDIPKLDIQLKRVSPVSLLDDGDVVFVDASEDDAGTSKHLVVVNKSKKPFISGLHTIVAKSKTDELAHNYRRYCFQTPAIRQQFLYYSVGTKVSGISKSNIPKLTLSFPSVPQQTAIASVLTEMDAELAVLMQRRDKTRALKQAMMQELLTGRTRLVASSGATE